MTLNMPPHSAKATIPEQQARVPTPKQELYLQVMKTMGILISTAVLLIWLNQTALSRYWQQRYHTDAPWHSWQGNPLWDFGAQLYITLERPLTSLIHQTPQTPSAPPSPITYFPQGFLQGQNNIPSSGSPHLTTPLHISTFTQTPLIFNPVNLTETTDTVSSNIPTLISVAKTERVLFIGDSMMQGIAPHLKQALWKQAKIESLDISRQSTGLRYPQFFNWSKALNTALKNDKQIRLVVIFLGPNDPWNMPADKQHPAAKFQSSAWEQRYRERIAELVDIAQNYQAQVIWIGPPDMRDEELSKSMHYLRTLYQSEVEQRAAYYLSANTLLYGTPQGYADSIIDGEITRKVRAADGIHFTPFGQRKIAKGILTLLALPEQTPTQLLSP